MKDNRDYGYDHTAPWKCSLAGCKECKKKPTYQEYMKKRKKT